MWIIIHHGVRLLMLEPLFSYQKCLTLRSSTSYAKPVEVSPHESLFDSYAVQYMSPPSLLFSFKSSNENRSFPASLSAKDITVLQGIDIKRLLMPFNDCVSEYFQSQLLSFSPNLDYHNPDIPEWRQDISRLIKRALIQVTHIPEEHILVAMFPGLPTSAELFILPPKNVSERWKGSKLDLEQIVESLLSALNQNLVMFELKPGVQIFVYVTQLTLGKCLADIT
ncbi:hypothetical protein AB205_0113730, partial [Aquarana catesbeiana]